MTTDILTAQINDIIEKISTNYLEGINKFLDYYFQNQNKIPSEIWAYKDRNGGNYPTRFTDKQQFKLALTDLIKRYIDTLKSGNLESLDNWYLSNLVLATFEPIIYYNQNSQVGIATIQDCRDYLFANLSGTPMTPRIQEIIFRSGIDLASTISS